LIKEILAVDDDLVFKEEAKVKILVLSLKNVKTHPLLHKEFSMEKNLRDGSNLSHCSLIRERAKIV